jgi:hypothetical protein
MDPDLPFILKIVALTLVLPVALAWLASLVGVTSLAVRSKLRKSAGDHGTGKPAPRKP